MSEFDYVHFIAQPNDLRNGELVLAIKNYISKAVRILSTIRNKPQARNVGKKQADLFDLKQRIYNIQCVLAVRFACSDEPTFQKELENAQQSIRDTRTIGSQASENYVILLKQHRKAFFKGLK